MTTHTPSPTAPSHHQPHTSQVPMEKDELEPATIECLQRLIRLDLDSAGGFAAAAEVMKGPVMHQRFLAIADERRGYAAELQRFVALNDVEAEDSGSVAGALRVGWMRLRAAVTSDDATLLFDVERAEEHMKDAYEHAIVQTAGSPMSDVLHRHLARVKEQYAAIHELREILA